MRKIYTVVLIEDERQAREELKHLLAGYPEIQVIGEARDLDDADRLCRQLHPDLVFCDVMLPGGMSFDWLASLDTIDFELIFITSFQDFAIRAFRLAALDYLLKPIDPKEFKAAIGRFLQKNEDQTPKLKQLIYNLQSPKEKAKIALPTLHGYLFVEIKEVIRCESDNTYTTFFLRDKRKILVSKTLKDVETMLEHHGFCRVHNSHLINLDYVTEYLKGEGGQVKLSDGSVVDVSRRRKEEFLGKVRGQ
ncbi:LytTR family DNA-binding domain-containing protein [Algoriphagus sp. AGSA1]|uniref:LytR/AlgR family response regulator transcription factor n=1 Tax=Algoriphagus sp. AGSA1 TaxID=2907213 RepID=UPI001F27DE7B|nr:LytTR family DNA-binding domain-containing protein [Algoriphagus sp. AGSA1]MCE7054952.1 LytTR family DNA-binding domain-containing protein [Algoriphagus sp. AGSA1]